MPPSIVDSFFNARLIPTRPGFGIPDLSPHPTPKKGQKTGILLHDPDTDRWEIDGMPLLCQSDPALNGPMDKLFATLPADKFPQKKDSKGNPIFFHGQPARYGAVEFRELVKNVGCYDTSIVTVIIAALANRATDLKSSLKNRTKFFDEITKSGNISKEINQLAWHYFQNLLGYSQSEDKNAKSITQPHYFHEVVADIGGGVIKESEDPYTYGAGAEATLANGDGHAFRHFSPSSAELTNGHIIDLMKDGTVPMIAYNRHTPVAMPSAVTGKNNGYTFIDTGSLHKVVFNGFQPGKYPLRIYDVGNGQPYNVRISSDLNEMNFDFSHKQNGIAPFDSKFVNRPYLIYEGEDKKPNNLVFFIEHYDGLKIRNGVKLANDPFKDKDFITDPHLQKDIVTDPLLQKDLKVNSVIKDTIPVK